MDTPSIRRYHGGSCSPEARRRPHPGRRVAFSDKENAMVVKLPSKNLVMEEVTILKRGEDLKTLRPSSTSVDSTPCSTRRIGPEPDAFSNQIRFTSAVSGNGAAADSFWGSPFLAAPSPSALPFPAMLLKGDALIRRPKAAMLQIS
ncbi:hypothetical protein IHE45_08G111700 [Dioscorea alata]|uniref:Uncharacterized protein n=1 Tax=Dioscorea alata TaxID=55571 RepID=A0ACB7VLY7_DIOAL|nr:hypothetical protein IHE45_08G111700 [Dioscorea alata]